MHSLGFLLFLSHYDAVFARLCLSPTSTMKLLGKLPPRGEGGTVKLVPENGTRKGFSG